MKHRNTIVALLWLILLHAWTSSGQNPFGTENGSFNGVDAYSNGSVGYDSGTYNTSAGLNTGLEWQCVEYVNRYYYLIYGMNIRIPSQNANEYYPNASSRGLLSFPNNGTTPPQVGDILCFAGGSTGAGHNAIVRAVSSTQVTVIQQNVAEDSRDINYTYSLSVSGGTYFVDGTRLGASYYCQGWLRSPTSTAKAQMTAPANGSTFNSSSVTFTWNAGSGVSDYFLYVGNSAGANDIYGADEGTALSRTVTGIPTDGRSIYVRLWSYLSGAWQYNDYTYTAFTGTTIAKAQMTSPANGSTFSSSSVAFTWDAGSGASDYFLYVGSSAGANDIYGADQGTALSRTVTGIPIDGRSTYVRLWSYLSGAWQYNDYTYTAFTGTSAAKAQMTSPANGSTFSSSSVAFTWNAGSGASDYFLYVGSSAGANDNYGADQGTALSHTVSGIPTDGRSIYVRLWSYLSGAWQYNDYTYTAFTGTSAAKAQVTSPANGSKFSSSSVAFTWDAGSGVSDYFLYVGTSSGANDIFSADQGTALSRTVTGIPTDGRSIYVRLWSYLSGAWQYNDYTYTAFTGTGTAKAQITSPVNGSTFGSSSVAFTWKAGSGVSDYYLYVGNSAGAYDIYGADQGAALSHTVSGIPTDGRTIYVRLWSYLSGAWQYNDYTYTASTGTSAAKAQMTSPANGSAFSSSSVAFTWNAGSGVSDYYLYVGNSAGAYDIYGADQGTALSRTVSGIPTDGRSIYVRLWSSLSSGWQYNDYTYTASTGGQLTDSQKQQIMLRLVDQYHADLPAEAILAVIFQEGGEGAFYANGYLHDSWDSATDAPWSQPNNGDGIMQVTSASGYHERSGTYSHTQLGYDHAIHDGCDFLELQFNNFGTTWEAVLHYNSGAGTLYTYKSGMGDPNYLGHVADYLGSLVPPMFGISNPTLVQKLNAAQQIVNSYVNDPTIQSGQPLEYYATYEAQLNAELHLL